MIIVRETFITEPGKASKFALLMKEVTELMGHKSKVMTDLVGNFNNVVMETEFKNLEDFEDRMNDYGTNKEVQKKMAGYTDMYKTGRREIYKIVL